MNINATGKTQTGKAQIWRQHVYKGLISILTLQTSFNSVTMTGSNWILMLLGRQMSLPNGWTCTYMFYCKKIEIKLILLYTSSWYKIRLLALLRGIIFPLSPHNVSNQLHHGRLHVGYLLTCHPAQLWIQEQTLPWADWLREQLECWYINLSAVNSMDQKQKVGSKITWV